MTDLLPARPAVASERVAPDDVHERLARHLLVDGFDLVLDTGRSHGSRLVDARTGAEYLDLYSFFASSPLGMNPDGLADDPTFLATLAEVAANKPANSDMYTTHYAEFVETFARVLGDPALPHLFFVEGGALAVENALKVAFDWKSRRNEAAGRSPGLGTRVLHLTRAFHGRSGYTLSLTNTEPVKTERYPKFDWPRIDVPAVRFGPDGGPDPRHLAELLAAERYALAQARAAFERHPHDVAAFIAEPIQGEGGDNHLRPEFLRAMQELCYEYDALFVLDEVQAGAGSTGTPWAYQQLGLAPDVVAFAKRVQVGGIMAGRRVDEIPDHALAVSGRVNSTWGGGLVDMVRSRRLLELVERDHVIAHVAEVGRTFLAELRGLAAAYPRTVTNVRGRGLIVAVDLPDRGYRDGVLRRLYVDERVLALPGGERAIRFRPALNIGAGELSAAVAALGRVLAAAEARR